MVEQAGHVGHRVDIALLVLHVTPHDLAHSFEQSHHLLDQTLVQIFVVAARDECGSVREHSPSDGLNKDQPDGEDRYLYRNYHD